MLKQSPNLQDTFGQYRASSACVGMTKSVDTYLHVIKSHFLYTLDVVHMQHSVIQTAIHTPMQHYMYQLCWGDQEYGYVFTRKAHATQG